MSTAGLAPETSRSRAALVSAIGCAICLVFGLIPLFMGAFPLFLQPVSSSFGWGLSVFPQSPMIVGLTAAATGPWIGRLVDRYGVRRVLAPGLAIWCAGFFALSLMNGSIAQLYLVTIFMAVGGTIAGPISYAKVVNGWFGRNRGLALGLVLGGVPAVATAIAVQVTQGLIDAHGWRATFRILAIVAAVVTIPAALLLVREASDGSAPGQTIPELDGVPAKEAVLSRDFILAIGSCGLAVGALMAVTAHFIGWMAERGVSKETATFALSLYSLAGPLGPLLGGLLVDRVQTPRIFAIFSALGVIGMALLLGLGGAGVLPGMALLGLAFSSINGLAPYLVSRYFGMASASEILGATFAVLTIGMGAGPVLMGLGHDLTGGYSQPIGAAMALLLGCTILGLLFRPYRFAAIPRQ
ncbi:MFS transporter [Novosphingobium sp. Leaf2]|uniref:MFS transporter n=1 Tax=Novosphingobium sp. Leaf2 TaxID=1735670 RepID=UPI000A6335CE|nr:MFS transporter [Novosphingobium sp. Leaf2]